MRGFGYPRSYPAKQPDPVNRSGKGGRWAIASPHGRQSRDIPDVPGVRLEWDEKAVAAHLADNL
jgi:hypothetical protein